MHANCAQTLLIRHDEPSPVAVDTSTRPKRVVVNRSNGGDIENTALHFPTKLYVSCSETLVEPVAVFVFLSYFIHFASAGCNGWNETAVVWGSEARTAWIENTIIVYLFVLLLVRRKATTRTRIGSRLIHMKEECCTKLLCKIDVERMPLTLVMKRQF